MTLFLAELHTDHFRFDAVGRTEQEAREFLDGCLQRHCRQVKLDYEAFRTHFPAGYVQVRALIAGQTRRDGEPL